MRARKGVYLKAKRAASANIASVNDYMIDSPKAAFGD
jgi:hypothetical protein